MQRLILAVVIVVGGQSVNGQSLGDAMGIPPALYQKVERNEILMTDAINITRAMKGIDITQRGAGAGPMSPAGMAELQRQMNAGGNGGKFIKPTVGRVKSKQELAKDRVLHRKWKADAKVIVDTFIEDQKNAIIADDDKLPTLRDTLDWLQKKDPKRYADWPQ
jgi:hypothetical protein